MTDESEDTDQSDMARTWKVCRVDLPSLMVERGSSEDVVVPRQVEAVVFTNEADQGEGRQDVEGKEVIRASRDQVCFWEFILSH